MKRFIAPLIVLMVWLSAGLMAFGHPVALGQEASNYHFSNCPAPAICCVVPAPLMTQPVPGGTPIVVPESAVLLYGAHVSNENTVIPTPVITPTPATMSMAASKPPSKPHLPGGLAGGVTAAMVPHLRQSRPGAVIRPRSPSLRQAAGVTTPIPGTAAAFLYIMSADDRMVIDPNAYANDINIGKQELQYLGVPHGRADFTCDNVTWGGGCDTRNLITNYYSTFPPDFWTILPNTAGSNDITTITDFLIPNDMHYGASLHALEAGNEANNLGGGFFYNGVACGDSNPTWGGCATWSADFHTAVGNSFPGLPFFSWIVRVPPCTVFSSALPPPAMMRSRKSLVVRRPGTT